MIRRILPLALVLLLAAPVVLHAGDAASDPNGAASSGTAPAGATVETQGGYDTDPDGLQAPASLPTASFEALSLLDWLSVVRVLLPQVL